MKERELDKTTWDSRQAREVAEPVVPLGQMRLLLTLNSEFREGDLCLRVAGASQSMRRTNVAIEQAGATSDEHRA